MAGPRRRVSRKLGAPTLADVARQAGVSAMTVSRALYEPDAVRETTRQAILKVVADLNYTPNAAARMLAGVQPMRVGLLLDDLGPGFLSDVLVGCMSVATSSNVQVIVQSVEAGEDPAIAVDTLLAARVNGVVLPPPVAEDGRIIDLFHQAGVPAVSLTASIPDARILAVHINDLEAAEVMTQHLVALGHRRIGFINGKPHLSASRQRLAGYLRGLADAGIAVQEALIAGGDFTYQSGLAAAERLLAADRPASAIFAGNDDMAAATVAVAHRLALDVPVDLTVCGFDDTMLATTIWPQLTTIRQPLVEMTKAAMAMLIEEVATPSGLAPDRRHRVFAHELIRRQSDAGPRCAPADPTVGPAD